MDEASQPPLEGKALYQSLADLEPDAESRGLLAASSLALSPLVLAVAMPCLGYVAPVAGALVLARASAHPGEARFAAFQMMVLGFALVVLMLAAQAMAALLGGSALLGRAAVAGLALGVLAWGLAAARHGRGPRLPLLSRWIFNAGLRGQAREG